MDQAPVTPPLVAGPLRLAPFRALRLADSRIADPASARTLARPYHDVQQRLRTWEQRGLLVHDHDAGALPPRVHGQRDHRARARRSASTSRTARHRLDQRAILPHEGIYPAQADDLADRMEEMGINPAPILLVQRSPAPLRELLATVRSGPAEQLRRPCRPAAPVVDAAGSRAPGPDRRRSWRPTTALIADGHHRYAAYLKLQRATPARPTDRGLAMLVDHDDTPLFLGAIHRLLLGSSDP